MFLVIYMYSINKKYISETVIQKSKFICVLMPINDENEVKDILLNIKEEYKGATHYCFAYITKKYEKYSDDGEPSGTAGNPILNVLKRKNLENILAVVIRYFGGIKLGAGGLVRAYTKAVTDCLCLSNIIQKKEGIVLDITVSYENINKIKKMINEEDIKEKIYGDNINLVINMALEDYVLIKDELNYLCIKVIEKESI